MENHIPERWKHLKLEYTDEYKNRLHRIKRKNYQTSHLHGIQHFQHGIYN